MKATGEVAQDYYQGEQSILRFLRIHKRPEPPKEPRPTHEVQRASFTLLSLLGAPVVSRSYNANSHHRDTRRRSLSPLLFPGPSCKGTPREGSSRYFLPPGTPGRGQGHPPDSSLDR